MFLFIAKSNRVVEGTRMACSEESFAIQFMTESRPEKEDHHHCQSVSEKLRQGRQLYGKLFIQIRLQYANNVFTVSTNMPRLT